MSGGFVARRILVTGGAGYIGSHTANLLARRGYEVTVVDDLSRGYKHNVDGLRFHQVGLAETDALEQLMRERAIEAVIHFAAYIGVSESMQVPELYFSNNSAGSLSLLTAMLRAGVKYIVFSSTAAVYGIPNQVPIREDSPFRPVNAYGESKVLVERMLQWFDAIHGIRGVCLRYFNASGADPEGRLGEEHDPETHLIPLMLRAVITGDPVTVYGSDYPTPDGTCIRDFVHVNDLAEAHILALEALASGGPSNQFNVGTGTGQSVRQMLDAVEKATGEKVPYRVGPRREGDPPALVASPAKLIQTYGWKPKYTDVAEIIATAWNFARNRSAAR